MAAAALPIGDAYEGDCDVDDDFDDEIDDDFRYHIQISPSKFPLFSPSLVPKLSLLIQSITLIEIFLHLIPTNYSLSSKIRYV